MRTIAWWTLWTMKTKQGQNWTWLHDPLWQQQNSTAIPLHLRRYNLCNTHMDAYGRISNTKLDNPIRQQQKSTTVPRSVVADALPQIQGATESINMDRGWRTHQTGRRSCRRELKSRPPRLRGEIRRRKEGDITKRVTMTSETHETLLLCCQYHVMLMHCITVTSRHSWSRKYTTYYHTTNLKLHYMLSKQKKKKLTKRSHLCTNLSFWTWQLLMCCSFRNTYAWS